MKPDQTASAETIAAYQTATALLTLVVEGDPGAEVLVHDLLGCGDDAVAGVLGALCGICVRLAPSLGGPSGPRKLRAETQRLAGLAADAALAVLTRDVG